VKKPEGALRLRPHNPHKLGNIPWLVCRLCGLVYLRNAATKAAIKLGCWMYEDE
jgi:hypothetical protein